MFILTVFRPELLTDDGSFDPNDPFEAYDIVGLFVDEEKLNKEIDTLRQQHPDWQFGYENAPLTQTQRWERLAADLGKSHARNTASWITDGNESDESRRYKLKMIGEGDPLMDTVLPEQPNLGGEWADEYDADKLIEEVTGRQAVNVDHDDREAIVNAWETSVNEHFVPACEVELHKWVD